MTDPSSPFPKATAAWSSTVVYGLAAVCLFLGVLVGYFVRGSSQPAADPAPEAAQAHAIPGVPKGHPTPTLEQMKQLADKKAEPLLAQLKKNPKDKNALVQTAYVYKSAHQFQDAVNYFTKALEVDPKDVAIRTEMASCLYYNGDVDGALSQLQQSLKYQPRDANSLFNLGMIKWKGKNDAAGAIAAWQELLKTNPKLERRPVVEQMIADAQQHQADLH
jgi:cytochrome c-type biogenesis protein CcmH/NrfG